MIGPLLLVLAGGFGLGYWFRTVQEERRSRRGEHL